LRGGGRKWGERGTSGGGLSSRIGLFFLFFRGFFMEMSLKHSACHTFRASRVPCNTPKSQLKSRKIDSVGDHISGKKHAKSVAGAVKVQSRGFT